jgi:hypothetical protein
MRLSLDALCRMEPIFDACVRLLMGLAGMLGLTYEQVNVLIFVILLPLGLIALVARTVWLERRLSAEGKARELTLPAVQVVFWSAVLLAVVALL